MGSTLAFPIDCHMFQYVWLLCPIRLLMKNYDKFIPLFCPTMWSSSYIHIWATIMPPGWRVLPYGWGNVLSPCWVTISDCNPSYLNADFGSHPMVDGVRLKGWFLWTPLRLRSFWTITIIFSNEDKKVPPQLQWYLWVRHMGSWLEEMVRTTGRRFESHRKAATLCQNRNWGIPPLPCDMSVLSSINK